MNETSSRVFSREFSACAYRWILPVVLIVLGCVGLADPTSADELVDREKRAINAFDRADYRAAAAIFDELRAANPQSERCDSWLYNSGRALYHLGRLEDAQDRFENLIIHLPQSPLVSYGRYHLGNCLFRIGELDAALAEYLAAYRTALDVSLADVSRAAVASYIASGPTRTLRRDDLLSLGATDKEDLLRSVTDSCLAHGLKARADSVKILSDSPARLTQPKEGALDYANQGSGRIALLASLSGAEKAAGEELQRGAELALVGSTLRLDAFDTKGDPLTVAVVAREIADRAPFAIIGPVVSTEISAALAATHDIGAPLFLPSMPDTRYAKINRGVFTLSPSTEVCARALAEYAVLGCDFTRAVVLSPATDPEEKLARIFAERFSQLGGVVLAHSTFPSRSSEYGAFCSSLKRRLLEPLDSAMTPVNKSGDTLDYNATPVTVDVVFIPSVTAQLKLILPLLTYYNIRGCYFGNEIWGRPEVAALTASNMVDVVYWNSTDAPDPAFSIAYRTRYGSEPSATAWCAYRAASWANGAALLGISTGEGFSFALNAGEIAKGEFDQFRNVTRANLFRRRGKVSEPISWTRDSVRVEIKQ